MTRKIKPENETVVPPDAAAPRPRRQTAASRARRASPRAATPAPPATDVDAGETPELTSSLAAPQPRRRSPAPRATRSQSKEETAGASAALQKMRERPPAAEPSREAIAQLAYLYWEARGGRDGSADDDWLRAERELWQRASR
jgi:Protein of unknown function (DUF2934)